LNIIIEILEPNQPTCTGLISQGEGNTVDFAQSHYTVGL